MNNKDVNVIIRTEDVRFVVKSDPCDVKIEICSRKHDDKLFCSEDDFDMIRWSSKEVKINVKIVASHSWMDNMLKYDSEVYSFSILLYKILYLLTENIFEQIEWWNAYHGDKGSVFFFSFKLKKFRNRDI